MSQNTLPDDMPPLPPLPPKDAGAPCPQNNTPLSEPEDPTWWRHGSVPFCVLVMVAAAADLAWPRTSGCGLGAGLGCLLAMLALLLLRKDFSKGERCFMLGLAVVNFAALVLSGSVINWYISLIIPFVVVMMPRKQEPLRAGQRFRNWWSYWTCVRRGPSASEVRSRVAVLRQLLPTFICILVGASLFIVFLTIFAEGNPVVEAVREVIVDTWNRIVAYLHISWDFLGHVVIWFIGIVLFGVYTFRRPDALPGSAAPAATPVPGRTLLPHLPICSLIGIDLAFLIATSTDIAYLWFGRVPEGISQTAYLHDGAASITWASSLAAVILVFLFRRVGSARRSIACNIAGYALVLQTFLLAVSVYMRLYYQINDCGFTVRRIQAAEALLLGVAGLVVLVCYMACSGAFWKYAKICLGTMFLILVSFSICKPARLAGNLNMRYADSHPQWTFSYADFGYGRFDVDENLAFACYVQQKAQDEVLARRIRSTAEMFESIAADSSWLDWNFFLSQDVETASKVLGHPIELHLTRPTQD